MQQLSTTFALLMATVVTAQATLLACDELVRDAAFGTPRDVHRLCLFAAADDPDAESMADDLTAWLAGPALHLNLELVSVNADDPDVQWSEYGIPSAPPVLPVVALIGHNKGSGKTFVIDHWEPGPTIEQLSELLSSPVRQQIQEEVGRRLAIVLFSSSPDSDGTARQLVETSVANWSDAQALGFSVIELDRTDSRERLLLSFAGIRPDDPDWVGVIFGRGKLMSPPLAGTAITQATMADLFEQVALDCSCSKPIHTLGVDLPLVWSEQQDATVVFLRDPSDSDDADSLAAMLPSFAGDSTAIAAVDVADAPDNERPPVHVENRSSPDEFSPLKMTLIVMAVGLIVVVVTSLVLVRKT